MQKSTSDTIQEQLDSFQPEVKEMCELFRKLIFEVRKENEDKFEIEEVLRWGAPAYNVKGKLFLFWWGLKDFARITFMNGVAMSNKYKLFNHCLDNPNQQTIRFNNISQIDEKKLKEYIVESAEISVKGYKKKTKSKFVKLPEELKLELGKKQNQVAKNYFETLSPSHKREYTEWIESAKKSETKIARIEKTIEMLNSKISKNKKYK